MFENHFGLRENPFIAGHQARFVYPSPEHQEALAHLRYGIENREPFVLITGEVGTGKTTALYDALAEWQSRVVVALITNSALTRNELLEEIALRFGVNVSGPISKPQLLAQIERMLAGVCQRGDRAIVLLDEAQNLERDLLEEIRLLSNLEQNGTKLIQVFLIGQPELEAKLGRPELRQLRQRITVHYRLRPLSPEDTEHYIHHRIGVAGGHAISVFPSDSCREVHRITHGIPREINNVCSQALLNAFVEDTRQVRPHHVSAAATEIEFESVLDTEGDDVPEPLRGQVSDEPVRAHVPEPEPEPRREPEPEPEHRGPPLLSRRPPPPPPEPIEPEIEPTPPVVHEPVPPPAFIEPAAAVVSEPPPLPPEPEPQPVAKSSPQEPDEDPAYDLSMIDTWMARLHEAKTAKAKEPEPQSTPIEATKLETDPFEFTPPPRSAVSAATSAPRSTPSAAGALQNSTTVIPPTPPRRSLVEEQRSALPPKLRTKLSEPEDFEEELGIKRSGSKGMLIGVIAIVLAIATVLLVRFGPWQHAKAAPPPVAQSTEPPTSRAAIPKSANGITSAASSPVQQAATPAPTPAPTPPPAPKSEPAPVAKPQTTYGIAVATYLDRSRAETEKTKLAASTQLSAQVNEVMDGGASVYRIVLGGFDSRLAAENAASELIRKGQIEEARVVPLGKSTKP